MTQPRGKKGTAPAPRVSVSAVGDAGIAGTPPVATPTRPTPTKFFVCKTMSSTLLHPATGSVMLRGVLGERKHAPVGSQLYKMLRASDAWEMEGHPDATALPAASYRKVGVNADQSAGG